MAKVHLDFVDKMYLCIGILMALKDIFFKKNGNKKVIYKTMNKNLLQQVLGVMFFNMCGLAL